MSTWRDSDDSEDYDPMNEGRSKGKRQVAVDGENERAPKRAKPECVEEPAFDKPGSTESVSEESSGSSTFLDSLPELEEDLGLDDAIELGAMDVDVLEEQSEQGKAMVTASSEESGLPVANKLEDSENQPDSSAKSAGRQSEDNNTPIPIDSDGDDEENPEVGPEIQGESNNENGEKQTVADNLPIPDASREEKPQLGEEELEDAPESADKPESNLGEKTRDHVPPVSDEPSGQDDGESYEKLYIGSNFQDERNKDDGGQGKEDSPSFDCSRGKEVEGQVDVLTLQAPNDVNGEAAASQSRTENPEPMVTGDEEVKEKEGIDAETKPDETAWPSPKAESDATNVDMQEPQSIDGTNSDSKNAAAESQTETETDHGIPKGQEPSDVDMVDSQPGANADEETSLEPQCKDTEMTQSAESSEPCSWCDDFAYGLVGFEKHRPGPMCARCVQQRSCIVKCTGHRTEPLVEFKPESFDFRAAYDSLNPGTGKRVMKTPWCSLCPSPAFFRCATRPATSGHLKSTEPGSVMGCGLMLCETCSILVQACNDLTWVVSFNRSEDPADGSRADVDYLLPGSELCK